MQKKEDFLKILFQQVAHSTHHDTITGTSVYQVHNLDYQLLKNSYDNLGQSLESFLIKAYGLEITKNNDTQL
jgi:hypothetical protein